MCIRYLQHGTHPSLSDSLHVVVVIHLYFADQEGEKMILQNELQRGGLDSQELKEK